MISRDLAEKLKNAGLDWQPARGDVFVVPDRGLDEQVFTINDMAVMVENLQGTPAVTFHGTPEWALDYVFLGEVLWLPAEEQLRTRLQAALEQAGTGVFDLLYADGVYTCRFEWQGHGVAFHSAAASDAYAAALLTLLAPTAGN